MRIAYLLDWDITANSGVLNKVEMQVRMWEEAGHQVFVCFTSYKTQKQFIIKTSNVRVFERPSLAGLYFNPVRTFVGKAISFFQVLQYLKKIKPDVLYFRQSGMWFPFLDKILKRYPTVMEVNTLDLKEITIHYNVINRTVYKYGRKRILKAVRGLVAVTGEIGKTFEHVGKPVAIIANGTQSFSQAKPAALNKSTTDLIFVCSPGQPWQGEDSVVMMAGIFPEFNFHIVGPETGGQDIPDNVRFYGYLNKQELYKLYEKMDVGIGTLALYRKGMYEACPLKVREYLALGLPVILGYTDTDLDGAPFALNIGCYPNNIQDHIEEIRKFIYAWRGKRVAEAAYMPLIGIPSKEEKRLAFMKSIAAEN